MTIPHAPQGAPSRSANDSWTIGNIRIDRVEEFCGPVFPLGDFLCDLPADAVERNLHWLAPNFIQPASGFAIMSDHSWVVRDGGSTILIDTCFGNDKPRPGFGGNLKTPWLQRLAGIGLTPERIDFVMCTHLHSDHVGWNTRLLDGRWVPTFPNARYLFGRREYAYWSTATNASYGHDEAFRDSILPCVEAGQSTLIDDGYAISKGVTVQDAPGHTVGNMAVYVEDQGARGVFSADIFHSPIQVVYPDVNSVACDLPDQARRTRRSLLGHCAEYGHLLLPGHLPAPYCGRVRQKAGHFMFDGGSIA